MLRVKLFESTWKDRSDRDSFEAEMNAWLKEVLPVVSFVTHEVHANKHYFSVWYLSGEK